MTLAVAKLCSVVVKGSGFSCRVTADDGHDYIMKLAGAGQGAIGLYHELIATRLAGVFGVPVPDVRPLWLPDGLPWDIGTDEFDDALRRSSGWNLGIHFIGDAADVSAEGVDALPTDFLKALARVDAILVNVDRTRANPNVLCDSDPKHWAIDFGACLYWRLKIPDGSADARLSVPRGHFLEVRQWSFSRPRLTDEDVGAIFSDAPDAWRSLVPNLERDVRRMFVRP